jgi:hypothetical protein
MNAVKQGGITSLQFIAGYAMGVVPSNGGYGYAPTNIGALAYSGITMANVAVNQFIPPISVGGMSFSLSLTPRGLALNQTASGNVDGFNLAYGINSLGDSYYGVSVRGKKGMTYSWYRTDFTGDMAQGVAGIGISGKNWSVRIDEDISWFGGDGYDRFRSGGFQAEWGDFILGGRVITNDNTKLEKRTISKYISPFNGEEKYPKNGVYEFGEVWSSPLMIGYKTKYGITAFVHDNPIYQRIFQNGIHASPLGHGTPFFQSQPYNSFSIKSYRQNPFSIYFY